MPTELRKAPRLAGAGDAKSEDLRVLFLGTGGSAPSAARAPLSLLIGTSAQSVLVDFGEGCARQLLAADHDPVSIDACLLTHLHADHYLGLPGLLSVLADRGRRRPLPVVGPRGLEGVIGPLAGSVGPLPFTVETTSTERVGTVPAAGMRALAFPVRHVGRALGYAFFQGERVGVVVSGDTQPCPAIERVARGARLLVHEATFCDDELERARETGHSTAREAALVARHAGVDLLAVVHLSSRYPPSQALREARSVFAATKLPRDLDQALVREGGVSWLPRRRAPVLVSGSGRSAR